MREEVHEKARPGLSPWTELLSHDAEASVLKGSFLWREGPASSIIVVAASLRKSHIGIIQEKASTYQHSNAACDATPTNPFVKRHRQHRMQKS
jgi:hypothetical protein